MENEEKKRKNYAWISRDFNFSIATTGVFAGKTTQLLASVFAGCCFVGVAVTATFMTRIRLFVYASASEKRKSDTARSFAAVRDAFRNTKLQLIAPLSVFIGLEQGFIYSDFSKVRPSPGGRVSDFFTFPITRVTAYSRGGGGRRRRETTKLLKFLKFKIFNF